MDEAVAAGLGGGERSAPFFFFAEEVAAEVEGAAAAAVLPAGLAVAAGGAVGGVAFFLVALAAAVVADEAGAAAVMGARAVDAALFLPVLLPLFVGGAAGMRFVTAVTEEAEAAEEGGSRSCSRLSLSGVAADVATATLDAAAAAAAVCSIRKSFDSEAAAAVGVTRAGVAAFECFGEGRVDAALLL